MYVKAISGEESFRRLLALVRVILSFCSRRYVVLGVDLITVLLHTDQEQIVGSSK
jgi:hypothetical protein